MSHLADAHPSSSPTDPLPEAPPAAPLRPVKHGSRAGRLFGLIFLAGLIAAIGLSVRSRIVSEAALKRSVAETAAVMVNVVHPSAIATTDEITLPGSAQAFLDTPIYARASGYLKSWRVDIGDRIKKGDEMAEIETPEVDQQLEQARADLKNAEANLDLSKLTATRSEDLFARKTISNQERDQAVSDLAAKRALVDSGNANVRRLEQLKAFEIVTAPFDGIVTARNTDIGALIQAGNATGARELFHLADNHILRVYFSVPEVFASTIKAGQTAAITFDAFPGETFKGDLVRDSAALDPHSHTLMVEADVQNPDGRLFPGGYATVHLKLPATLGAVNVPANTLLFRAEGARVAVVRNGRIVLIPIVIGRDHGNSFEVIGGLTPKDSVVLDPPDSLVEGATVQINPAKRD